MQIALEDIWQYDDLSNEEIKDAFVRVAEAVGSLRAAMSHRLVELGYYDTDYIKGSNPEVDELLNMLNEDF